MFGRAVRQSIDEVLDGPRTGRWSFQQLEKTEKTYVGTKLEIVVRTTLGLEPGGLLDLDIEGYPVDIKWAMNSSWQIPREALGQLCLCIGGLSGTSRFQVGLVRCTDGHLNSGRNQDLKRTLSAEGRRSMRFLVHPARLPENFVEQMDDSTRADVMAEPTIQKRVMKLFKRVPRTPIPRDAICTVARTTGDPMRRVRANALAGDSLAGMRILSAKYGNRVVEALGYPRLESDQFMAVPATEIAALPPAVTRSFPDHLRARYGFD